MTTVNINDYNLITNAIAAGGAPYQTFTGDYALVYQYLCNLIGTDIRSQYVNTNDNLATTLGTYYTDRYYEDGNGFTKDEFNYVIDILATELKDVDNVIQLYDNWATFYSNVFNVNSDILTTISSDLQVAAETPVSTVPATVIEGLIYAVVSTVGTAGGFVANIISAAWNTVNAANGASAPSTQPILSEFANLMQDLIDQFQTVNAETTTQANQILANWGMTQAVGALALNQLAATTTDVDNAGDAATAAFGVSAAQSLMNVSCAVTGNMFNSGAAPAAQTNTWVIQADTWSELSLTMQSNGDAVPSSVLQTYLWDAGVSQQDVFLAQNGWNLPYMGNWTVNGFTAGTASDNDAVLLLFVVNASSTSLLAEATTSSAEQTGLTQMTQNLNGGAFVLFAAGYTDGPQLNFGGYGGDTNSVVSCNVSIVVHDYRGGAVTTDPNAINGWTINVQTWEGSYAEDAGDNGYPAVCVVTAYFG